MSTVFLKLCGSALPLYSKYRDHQVPQVFQVSEVIQDSLDFRA